MPDTYSKFESLGADSDTMDGLNVHCAVIDELHAHKSREMWDVLLTATGARRQPLIFAITTAGFDMSEASICWLQREYSGKLLSAEISDDSYFTFISTLDEGDDW
jgi:phage terminase large subunit-like protein